MFDQQLEHWLTPFKTARQRAVFIFTPHNARERERILYELEHALPEPLWLSDSSERFVQMHRYRDYLGLTTSHVVLDFAQLVHADALAALAGTVNGGHCLWLVLPVTASHFQQRLLHHAAQFDGGRALACIGCRRSTVDEHAGYEGGQRLCLAKDGAQRPLSECHQ